jgi:hypothetical protein
MTKDEDDWLADFLEVAQSTAKQSQAAAEKDYATKLKLMKPRFDRASAADADQAMAGRLAAGEALAGQKKYDAALDELEEALCSRRDCLPRRTRRPPSLKKSSCPGGRGSGAMAEDEIGASPDEVVMAETGGSGRTSSAHG